MQIDDNERDKILLEILGALSPKEEKRALSSLNDVSNIVSAFTQAFFLTTFMSVIFSLIDKEESILVNVLYVTSLLICLTFFVNIYSKLYEYYYLVISRKILFFVIGLIVKKISKRIINII